jgi:hypothetical protein
MKIIAVSLAVAALNCAAAVAEPVAVDSPRWVLEGADSRVVGFKGSKALYLKAAIARLPEKNFDTGVIEFDMLVPDNAQSFPGILFRGEDDGNYEHVYIRPHQNGNPDASQYTPFFNGMTGWQIYSKYNSQKRFPFNEWFHVRLEVAGDSARLYLDGGEPTLVIHDLKRDRQAGFVILKGSSGGAYFANIDIEPRELAAAPPEPPADLPAGLVRAWAVSPATAEGDAYARASANRSDEIAWTSLPVETNGIANIARLAEATEAAPTVLTRLTVRADRARSAPMRFGFSDRVQIYLNGTLLYAGDDSQGSRDYRFLGTVGFYDTLQLPLRRGTNEIVFAVSEGGGGWAASAAFPDRFGLTLVSER